MLICEEKKEIMLENFLFHTKDLLDMTDKNCERL